MSGKNAQPSMARVRCLNLVKAGDILKSRGEWRQACVSLKAAV